MSLIIIAAVSDNNVIGINGKIPWRIPEDMDHFRKLTLHHPVIMGRKTYESLPSRFKPLPERKNIILSKQMPEQNGIYIARGVREAIDLCENEDSYIIGGSDIYRAFFNLTEKLELTRVHGNFVGDAYFPEINPTLWTLIASDERRDAQIPYSFLTYARR